MLRGPAVALALAGTPALAGDADGEVALDYLRASSSSTDPGAGTPEDLTAQELGMRVRLGLDLADDRFAADVDYYGREGLPGDVEDSTLRLLYVGQAAWTVVPERWTVAGGRFLAPSAILLPVDGLRTENRVGGFALAGFAGRRGITTSRRNVPFGNFLPAAGASAGVDRPKVQAQALAAWAKDEAIVTKGAAGETAGEYGAANALARAVVRPSEEVAAGGQLAFAQQATYVLGPAWTDVEVSVGTLDLWNAVGWADWRPADPWRFSYDLHHQRVGVYRAGTLERGGAAIFEDIEEPNFTDNRVRAGWSPARASWVRASVRHRLRPDRQELRSGVEVDAQRLALGGVFARGSALIDDLIGDDPAYDGMANRLLWSAAAGWRRDAIDAEVGASFLEVDAVPRSSRRSDAPEAEDLAPFVLEAQTVAFARVFWSGRTWFAGADIERNLDDAELRAMVQAGALWDASW